MGRKSSIDRLTPAMKRHIDKRFREGRMTLNELIEDLQQQFPEEQIPSRSALGRKRQGYEEMAQSMREIDAAASALVSELGDGWQDKSGALLAQAVTTLAANAAFGQLEKGNASVDDVLKLARAAKSTQEARTLSLKERQALKREALEQAATAAEQVARQQGLSDTGVQALRDAIKSQL